MQTNELCEVENCDRARHARGMCRTHYLRLRRLGSTDLPAALTPAQRLAERLVEIPAGCHEWTGPRVPRGYGMVHDGRGRKVYTHRLAWELAHGAIPEGMQVCHHCDNPPCCDVSHLFLGTSADNHADMSAKGRHHNQRKTHCPRGHPYDDGNTYMTTDGRRQCKTCKHPPRLKAPAGTADDGYVPRHGDAGRGTLGTIGAVLLVVALVLLVAKLLLLIAVSTVALVIVGGIGLVLLLVDGSARV